jgi:outer membrane receptor for ferrienterochelin and colicin
MSWQTPWEVTASLTRRYTGKVRNDYNDPSPALYENVYGGYDYFHNVIPAYCHSDLAASWSLLQNIELRAEINSIMDKDPPVIGHDRAQDGANTYSTYDQLGRQVFAAVTMKF